MTSAPRPAPASSDQAIPIWEDSARAAHFDAWLQGLAEPRGLLPASLRMASSDASFRRYFRIDCTDGSSRIIMDAPPEHEDNPRFLRVDALMHAAGLRAPEILAQDLKLGFLLLSDLGTQTMIQAIQPQNAAANRSLYEQALDCLLTWQLATRPGVLPPYDHALLRRELDLFPDWYLGHHRGVQLSANQRATLNDAFELIIAHNLAAPQVYVHRDFMPRNLMLDPAGGALGVLDFQDAVHGPITYDIASLMRDAFLSWDEDFVLDITIRYWERARKAGLMDYEDWANDFGSFWRAVEWMGLQRHLKVAGIFARITLRDGKPKYLADAPRFIAYIRHTAGRYRELKPLLRLVDEVEGIQEESAWVIGR